MFAELLLHTSTAWVWKAARLQVEGLPDCPDFLTEQKYARLVFGANCQVRPCSTAFVLRFMYFVEAGANGFHHIGRGATKWL